jgi:hypothetical protein
VDLQAPVTKALTDALLSNTDIRIFFDPSDSESGVNSTFFRIGREKADSSEYLSGNEAVLRAEEDHSADGNYTVQYYSVDKMNNTESVKELKVRIDTQVFLRLGFSGTPSVNVDMFTVEGRTEQGAGMTINDEKVTLSSDGSFSFDLGLNTGRNNVTIQITDLAGNVLKKTVYINYEKPGMTTGWLMVGIIFIAAVGISVAGGLVYLRKKKRINTMNKKRRKKHSKNHVKAIRRHS